MTNSSRWSFSLLALALVTVLVSGCATTGRGEYPAFTMNDAADRSLAVVPPLGATSDELRSSILYHLDRDALSRTFSSVKIVSKDRVNDIMDPGFSINQLSWIDPSRMKKLSKAELLLFFEVHEFSIEQFTTTETRTLFSTRSRNRNTSVQSEDNVYIDSTETEFSAREVPTTQGNLRVVLSLSAAVYDTRTGEIIWRGRRIERAEDELEDLSSTELKDIVVERVMYRINNRLTG